MDAPPSDQRDVEENKDIAAFGYIWVMSCVVYVLKRHSPFVRFHAKQAMLLFALSIPIAFIPFTLLSRLLGLCILAGMVYGFLAAAQGQWKNVPFVGPLAHGEMTLREAWKQLIDIAVRGWRLIPSLFSRVKRTADDSVRKGTGSDPSPIGNDL